MTKVDMDDHLRAAIKANEKDLRERFKDLSYKSKVEEIKAFVDEGDQLFKGKQVDLRLLVARDIFDDRQDAAEVVRTICNSKEMFRELVVLVENAVRQKVHIRQAVKDELLLHILKKGEVKANMKRGTPSKAARREEVARCFYQLRDVVALPYGNNEEPKSDETLVDALASVFDIKRSKVVEYVKRRKGKGGGVG